MAHVAGVAKPTVSRVLLADPLLNVRDEVRTRILEAAAELRYVPNAHARGLRMARSRSLGVIVPELHNPIFLEIIGGVERAAMERGYTTLIAHVSVRHLDHALYRRMVLGNRVDGLVVCTILDSDLRAIGARYLLVNREDPHGSPSVRIDYAQGVRLAADHLTGAGHRHIGIVLGPLAHYPSSERLRGYRRALAAAGLPYRDALVIETDFTHAQARERAQRLLSGSDRPTAVIAGNPVLAAGVMAAARECGLALPGELAIVSLSVGPLAEMLNPTLTAIRFPCGDLGALAAHELIELVEGRSDRIGGRVLACDELVVRASSRILIG